VKQKTSQTVEHNLQTFVNHCFRKIESVRWPEVISNQELWSKTGQEEIIVEIKRRKSKWIKHLLGKKKKD
jgi:hypothetical protein